MTMTAFRHLALIAVLALPLPAVSQQDIFRDTLYNDEYNIFIVIDFYNRDVIIEGQEIIGPVDGYIASTQCAHVWMMTSSEIKSHNTAVFSATNNYGSEDFTARLTLNSDSTFTMRHTAGSTLKFPVKNKWQKIPSTVTFRR